MFDDIVIVAMGRTPIGSFGGSLKNMSAVDLGTHVVKGILEHSSIEKSDVDEVIMGCVGQYGMNAFLARMAALNAGLDRTSTAQTVNRLCASGLQAIITAAGILQNGDAKVIVAGGAESMSQYPYYLESNRFGSRMGDVTLKDQLMDALREPFTGTHIGITAENIAKNYGFERVTLDTFALESQNRALEAISNKRFKNQILPITISSKKGTWVMSEDEYPRKTDLEQLAQLKPIFDPQGVVTAGNASGINDGAAALLMTTQKEADQRGIIPIAKVLDYVVIGVDPSIMGLGPISAVNMLLEKNNLTIEDIDLFELNEAFASQALACIETLGIPHDKVNVNGSGIALGHPIGATGAIIAVKLIDELLQRKDRYGIATLCIGGGQGIACLFENIDPSYQKTTNPTLEKQYEAYVKDFIPTIVVLDDDPTGIQTVHHVPVYTDWNEDSIKEAFQKDKLFYILTNSRSLLSEETEKLHALIANRLYQVAKTLGKSYVIISRSDSTLRGHYPLETQTLCESLEIKEKKPFDGEILIPYFEGGRRFTINGIHYIQEGYHYKPVGETEFAQDPSFGYISSHLGAWVEEKTKGKFSRQDVVIISLDILRNQDIECVKQTLLKVKNFQKVVVDATCDQDLKVFTIACIQAMEKGKRFLFRTAAAFPKILGGIKDQSLLHQRDCCVDIIKTGGLIIIGSHVEKTTKQFEVLKENFNATYIEMNQHLVLDINAFKIETFRVQQATYKALEAGETVVLYTKRERFDLKEADEGSMLKLASMIADSITSVVSGLNVQPKYILAKGGITSSDIGTKGLGVKKAMVLGQIKTGIPVWLTGPESLFPNMPYIIFPGNVGDDETLYEIIKELEDETKR